MSERVKMWTPGPWVIDTDTRPAEICTIHHTNHDNGFVYVRGEIGYWNADGDENMANATLISAAPALVEALEMVVKANNEDLSGGFLEHDEAVIIDRALAMAYGDWRESLERRPHQDHKEGEGVEWEPGVDLPPVGAKVEIDGEGLMYGHGESGAVVGHFESAAIVRMSYGLGCFTASVLKPAKSHRDKVIGAAEKTFLRFASSKQIGEYKRRQILGGLYDVGALKLPGEEE